MALLDRVVGPGRALTAEERSILNVDDLSRVHNDPRLRFHAHARERWVAWVAEVARALAKAPLGKERGVRVPLPPAITRAYQRTLREVFETGRRHVTEELQRQGEARRALRDPSDPGLGRLRKKARAEAERAERALVGSLADQAQAHKLAGSTRAATTAALTTTAASRIDRDVLNLIDRGVPFTYNEGRIFEAEVRSAEIAEEVYTAMMDKKTCANCSRFDGLRGPRGTFTVPNPDCDGGLLCRCFVYYILKDERRATREGDPDPFRTMARQLPPGKASLSDIDPLLVDSFSREISAFIEANPGAKLGQVSTSPDVTQPMKVLRSVKGAQHLRISSHYYGDQRAVLKRFEPLIEKGWVPQGVKGEALLHHDLRRSFAEMRWTKGLSENWTKELQGLQLRRGPSVSLNASLGPKEFYQDLYSLRLANPGALDDELRAVLDVIEGRRKTLGITKTKKPTLGKKPTTQKNPKVKKAATKDAPPKEIPPGAIEDTDGLLDFSKMTKADRDEWFTWRSVKSPKEFEAEWERVTGGRVPFTGHSGRKLDQVMMAEIEPAHLNAIGERMAEFARTTKQAYWPREWHLAATQTEFGNKGAGAFFDWDGNVVFRGWTYKKGDAARLTSRRSAGALEDHFEYAEWKRGFHVRQPDGSMKPVRITGESFAPGDHFATEWVVGLSKEEGTMVHELGHARSILFSAKKSESAFKTVRPLYERALAKDRGSGLTPQRTSAIAKEWRAALKADKDAFVADLKAKIAEHGDDLVVGKDAIATADRWLSGRGHSDIVARVLSNYGGYDLDETYAEFYVHYMNAERLGRLDELPKNLRRVFEAWEKEIGW